MMHYCQIAQLLVQQKLNIRRTKQLADVVHHMAISFEKQASVCGECMWMHQSADISS